MSLLNKHTDGGSGGGGCNHSVQEEDGAEMMEVQSMDDEEECVQTLMGFSATHFLTNPSLAGPGSGSGIRT